MSARGVPPRPGEDAVVSRKHEHVLYAQGDVEARRPAGWQDVELIHAALPEVDFEGVDLSTRFLGRSLGAPVVIAAMTGGWEGALRINARLARAAERHRVVMALGSQRAALRRPELASTYTIAREVAPEAFLVANIGAAQLVAQPGSDPITIGEVRHLVEMIQADALAIHINFLEEVVQPEGDRRARGCLDAIARIVDALPATPVIAKETGAGLSPRIAARLREAGVAALDVGGRGGTSFAAVEGERAAAQGDDARARLGELFRDWGLPTAVSVAGCRLVGLPLIATGGIRTGLDAAKAIALGADLVGIARPFLEAALRGEEAVGELVLQLQLELATAMFLTGAGTLPDLRRVERVIRGETRSWLAGLAIPE